MFFIAVIFDFTSCVCGKPLQKRKCHSNTCMYTHTHMHIWMPMYFALNSGYTKCSCGTRPGQVWSIQLGLFVASTSLTTPVELFWNKRSLSKYFLLPGPWVTLQPRISSSLYKYINFFVKQKREIHCMARCYCIFSHQSLWGKNKYIYFSEVVFHSGECSHVLTSPSWPVDTETIWKVEDTIDCF